MNKKAIKIWLKKRYVAFIPPVIYLIISFTGLAEQVAFVPDYLNLSKSNPSDYFGLVIGAIASILGILMAVVLLSVEFSKEKLVGNVNINPLDNHLIKNSLYNSVNLIGLSFLAYIEVTSFDTESNLTIGYFIGIYFMFYIFSVYPVIKEIIGKTSRIKENLELVNSLNLTAFKSVSRYRFQSGTVADDTLNKLQKEIDEYILTNKITSYEKINTQILGKVFTELGKGHDRDKCDIILGALTWIWRENAKTAVRVNDTNYFELVWNSVRDIYLYFAKYKIPLLHLQEIDLFVGFEFMKIQTSHNISLPFMTAIDNIELSFLANLYNNCPEENLLKDLNRLYDKNETIEHSIDLELQWDAIKNIIRILHKIQEAAIQLSDKDLFESSTRKIESICTNLFWQQNNVGIKQKSFLTWRTLVSSFYHSSEALKSGLYKNTLDSFHIPGTFIRDLIKNEEVDIRDVKVIITNLANYIIDAQKDGTLFVGQGYGTLVDFCGIGIHSLKYYQENKKARKSINYIIRVLQNLKKNIEKNHLPMEREVYLHLESRFKHFVKVAVDHDGFLENENPVKKWNKIIKTFKKVPEVEEREVVKWK
ncbi:hypothetical protein HPE56_20155 [Maribacter sp. ANRC-HE7]|uniref:DUF2254 domain-containing protein n=1 Tax=Maribacter aquimaris TaxID=2737171 RepID=A0ABR7V5T6_9FLAO|nr:hypothetical protein [Maribacter aquimaris]MBD0780118.1 hypothetical protein [Maribacter aquimaris]